MSNYDPGKVIGDLDLGLEVRASAQAPPTRHIGILGLRRADMDPKDVVTTALEVDQHRHRRFAVAARPGAKTTLEPLLLSSDERGADARGALQCALRSVGAA